MSDRIRQEVKDKAVLAARLLTSNQPGEVVAALAAIDRLLPAGMTASELLVDAIEALPVSIPVENVDLRVDLRSMPAGGWLRCPWVNMARECLNRRDQFDVNELAFLTSMATWRTPPSVKQTEWLTRLHATLQEAA